MIDFMSKDRYGFADLLEITKLLRGPGGCPWDAAQTHLSIRRNFLEEAYEACEGFDNDDPKLMCEELGDVLLQVVFHADIEKDSGRFDIDDICDMVCKKLVFRHPHVFGGEGNDWEQMKQLEKGQTTATETLDAVARSLPALWRGEKIQKKAAKSGFTWGSPRESLDKIEEEAAELRAAVESGANTEEELGDLLFSVVNTARLLEIDPEQALHKACEKFIGRFSGMESSARQDGKALSDLSAQELLALWSAQKQSVEYV